MSSPTSQRSLRPPAGRRATRSFGPKREGSPSVCARPASAGVTRWQCWLATVPTSLLMHYAVPGAKAALVALNTRLAPQEYEYILLDSGADVLFVEPALSDRIRPIAGRSLVPDRRVARRRHPLGVEQRSGHRVWRMARWRCHRMDLWIDRTTKSTPSPSTTRAAPPDDPKGRSTRTGVLT